MEQNWLEEAIRKNHINFRQYEDFKIIIENIGSGASGKVSKAEWVNRDMFVAIKKVKPVYGKDAWRNFIIELKNHNQVGYHQNIIGFYGISKDSSADEYLMVLEYANQGTLRKYLQNKFKFMNWDLKIKLAKELASGVKCLHEEGIVHRDLHSLNVLVHDDTIKIADLGLSKQLAEKSHETNEIRGIMPYIEPQALNIIGGYKLDKLDTSSDVYSVGVLLWEISSGHPPFEGFSDTVMMLSIISGERETSVINTPLEYESLYIKCWDKNPKKRPLIKEVSDELKNISANYQLSCSNSNHTQEDISSLSTGKASLSSSNISSNMSTSILDVSEDIIKKANELQNKNKGNNNSQDSIVILEENNEEDKDVQNSIIISREDYEFLNNLVTKFINSVNNGDEIYQITMKLSHFVKENNRNPIDIFKLLTNTQKIEHRTCIIGLCHLNGYGTNPDKTRAFKNFKLSAENRCDSMGYYFLGQCYLLGMGTKADPQMAFLSFLKSAENENIAGKCLLGYCYQMGIGTNKNNKEAVEWYQKSNNALALCNLAYCYQHGIYLEKNFKKAFNFYQMSANAENSMGQYYLGCCYQEGIRDEIKAFELFEKSAIVGNILAQCKVGWCYQYGKGISKDEEMAFIWYKKSAESGNALAQNQLAYCYSAGIGVKKDKTKAFEWFQKSAKRGNASAQFNLGIYYNFGIGTKTDKKKAKFWYETATKNGNSEAKKKKVVK